MVKVLPRVQSMGLRKGLSQGNSTWLAVGVGAWGLRKLHSMSQRQTEILLSEELKPGERIIIANGRATIERDPNAVTPLARSSRRARRKAKKRGNAAA